MEKIIEGIKRFFYKIFQPKPAIEPIIIQKKTQEILNEFSVQFDVAGDEYERAFYFHGLEFFNHQFLINTLIAWANANGEKLDNSEQTKALAERNEEEFNFSTAQSFRHFLLSLSPCITEKHR
jgi:hypothetical protein